MAKRYEYYNTGDDDSLGCPLTIDPADTLLAQTFTPQVSHKITSVKLKVYKAGGGSPVSLATVGIRATSEEEPTGSNLTSGTFDVGALTTDEEGEWVTIPLNPYALIANTKYAIVVSLPDPDPISLILEWRENTSPDYDFGEGLYSINAGSTWIVTHAVFMFEEWGNAIKYKGNILIDQLIYQHAERMIRQ